MAETSPEHQEANSSLFRRFCSVLRKFNLFHQHESLTLTEQLIATRLNIFCLFVSLCILIVIRGLASQSEANLITSPTLTQFDHLYNTYPSTISCSCTQINTHYNVFLSLAPQYHQVCSSDFISEAWIASLFNSNKTDYYPLDFRLSASSQFQIINLLCRIVVQTVEKIQMQLMYKQLLSNQLLSRSHFQVETEAYFEQMREEAMTNLLRMDKYFELNIEYNHLVSSLRTNYYVYSIPGSRAYTTYTGYYLSLDQNDTETFGSYCCCDETYRCAFYSGIYTQRLHNNAFYQPNPPPMYLVPGILAGCLPRFSLMKSTLECFYDFNCLNTLQSLRITNASFKPMNTSVPSKFAMNSTVQSIFAALFIEGWNWSTNYTSYFQTCAPLSCTYTYVQRFQIIYIITSLLGLLGGLTTAFNLLIPLAVKQIIRRIRRICCQYIHHEQEPARENNRDIRSVLMHFIRQIWKSLITFSVFDKSILLPEIKQKIWSTRIYIVLLALGTVSLAIYSSVISHSNTVTIENPTRDQFETMYEKYSLTLSCPCTQISVSYSNIMSIQPRFHEVCSSDFIREDKWLQYFNLVLYNSTIRDYNFYSQDFRISGGLMFRILKVLCEFVNETVSTALTTFNDTQFINKNPLTAKNFDEQTAALIDRFQKQTLDSFLSLFSTIRTTMDDNHFHTSIDTNFIAVSYYINGTWYVRLRPRGYPNQTTGCLTSNQCSSPQGFYCVNITCQMLGVASQTIPGLVKSCLPINSLLLSTLECFYNQSCIQMLYDWRLFGIEDLFQPFPLNVARLNPNISSRYSPTTELGDIVSQLLIERWIVNSDVSAHYQRCQPQLCTYTYVNRFQVAYVITTVIGLFGGLSVILRLIIPSIVRILTAHIEKRRPLRIRPESQINHDEIVAFAQRPSLLVRFQQMIRDLEIFHAEIDNSIWATRIYFSLLLITFLIISVFIGLNRDVQVHTISLSSQLAFETLYQQHHSDSLSCPCSQSSIRYNTFLSVSVYYHQVCSSSFVSSDWWNLIGSSRGREVFLLLDQSLLSSHFRTLSSLCRLAQETANNASNALLYDTFTNIETLTNDVFHATIQSTLRLLIKQTPTTFVNTLDYVIDTFRSNQLEHLFLSNWVFNFTTANEDYIIATRPLLYNNNTCACATSISASCFWPMTFLLPNTSIMTLPGFVGGCLPTDGLRQSTLECLFDSVCLEKMSLLINGTTSSSLPKHLNKTSSSRYPYSTTKVNALIRELFIEEWLNTTNYSAYYEQCSPRACQYMSAEQDTLIYIMVLLLGLYGGLTISVRFIVTHAFKLLQ